MSLAEAAFRLTISAWLVYLALADIRHGQVTNWATVPPLLGAVAWQTVRGEWTAAVLLVLGLFVAEWPITWPLGIAGIVAIWPQVTIQGMEATTAVWIVVLVLWLLDVLGGADVKAVMTLMVLFPDPRLAWLLLLAWLGFSLVYVVRRHGRTTPRVLLSTLGKMAHPSRSGHRSPALPAVAMAGLVYVWFYL